MTADRTPGKTTERAVPSHRRRPSALALFGSISARGYVLAAAASFTVVIAAWAAAVAAGLAPETFLPSPGAVIDRLATLWADGTLALDIGDSMVRIAVGFTIATLIAIPVGILIGTYPLAEAIVEPLVDFIRYMPVVGFVTLTIIWVGIGDPQKWTIVFIGTFFQEVLLVMDNVKRTPKELVDIGRTLGLRDRGLLTSIVLRAASPGIWDTLRISLGWAWTWIVLAELVAATTGLGYRITVAKRYLQTDTIIGYLIVLGILGLITDQVMKLAGRRLFRWAER